MNEPTDFPSELSKQIVRCQGLLIRYKELGPVGALGHAAIKHEIDRANKAVIEGDTVQMIRSFAQLKECE
jgi:hypothetical protein